MPDRIVKQVCIGYQRVEVNGNVFIGSVYRNTYYSGTVTYDVLFAQNNLYAPPNEEELPYKPRIDFQN